MMQHMVMRLSRALTLSPPTPPLLPPLLRGKLAALSLQPCRCMCSHVIPHFLDPYEVDPKLPPPGRRWRAAEIRLKNSQDLQKLWIVLLKERNMLASAKMLHRARKTRMPHSDRIRNVKLSMANIRIVLAERERERERRRTELVELGQACEAAPLGRLSGLEPGDGTERGGGENSRREQP
mmetsp:Transcript_34675/g.81252  ORF Transcript_34675/g.81252 Transcript_34675/m.81252 type:complete len:180 (-) Transcript_34675:521-1060(-)